MELLIFSDSHGKREAMERAFCAQIRCPDLVLHLGDGMGDLTNLQGLGVPIVAVRGNCDWFGCEGTSEEFVLQELGHTILMTHGHRFGVKGGIGGLLAHAAKNDADIVLFGHTHQPLSLCIPAGELVGGVVLSRPMYVFNPGSIGKAERDDGYSFGTLSLTRQAVLLSHGRIPY